MDLSRCLLPAAVGGDMSLPSLHVLPAPMPTKQLNDFGPSPVWSLGMTQADLVGALAVASAAGGALPLATVPPGIGLPSALLHVPSTTAFSTVPLSALLPQPSLPPTTPYLDPLLELLLRNPCLDLASHLQTQAISSYKQLENLLARNC
ncbi:hypothetical protein AAVH_42114 [Aphelenchoides avenae]|nr:hypothetical protein AAVH_42114 [Aphelenchus avenae]